MNYWMIQVEFFHIEEENSKEIIFSVGIAEASTNIEENYTSVLKKI